MNVQMLLWLYKFALRERKSESIRNYNCSKKVCNELQWLIMPTMLEAYFPSEDVYFATDNLVPIKNQHMLIYPKEIEKVVDCYPNIKRCKKIDVAKMIGMKTNFEVFSAFNLEHSHYHTLKIHLLVHDCFSRFLGERIDMSRHMQGVYRGKYSTQNLTIEQLEKEIELFQHAVMIYIAECMKLRYDYDIWTKGEVSRYVYEVCNDRDNKTPEILIDAMRKAVSTPDDVIEGIKNNFNLLDYNSEVFPNLIYDVHLFVSKAYELVYHEL